MQPLLGLAQLVDRAAGDDLAAVLEEDLQRVACRSSSFGRPSTIGQHDDAERLLQRRVLVELVQHDLGDGVALQLDDDRACRRDRTRRAGRRCRRACFSFTSSAMRSMRRALFTWYGISVTMIDARPVLSSVSISARARIVQDAAARRGRPRGSGRWPQMKPPVGKSGPGDEPHQLVDGELRVLDERDQRVAHLAQVVRRDVRRHADGDARRAVDEQVRDCGRQDDRLLGGLVEVRERSRRSPCRCRRAAPRRAPSAGTRCSGRPPAGSPSTEPKLPWPSISG